MGLAVHPASNHFASPAFARVDERTFPTSQLLSFRKGYGVASRLLLDSCWTCSTHKDSGGNMLYGRQMREWRYESILLQERPKVDIRELNAGRIRAALAAAHRRVRRVCFMAKTCGRPTAYSLFWKHHVLFTEDNMIFISNFKPKCLQAPCLLNRLLVYCARPK